MRTDAGLLLATMSNPTEKIHPGEIDLVDPDGTPVKLGDYRAHPLIVVLVRYFGCLPCQHFLQMLENRVSELPEHSGVIAVGGSAAYQARWLRDRKGVSIPLLLDPEHRVRRIAEVGGLSARQLGSLQGWKNYGRALAAGFLPQLPTIDADKAPGIAIFNHEFELDWVHSGEMMGDYPAVEELITRVADLR